MSISTEDCDADIRRTINPSIGVEPVLFAFLLFFLVLSSLLLVHCRAASFHGLGLGLH